MEIIQTMRNIPHKSATTFLEHLRPSAADWWDDFTAGPTHVFRGHANASWRLLPKGWRPLDQNLEIASLIRMLSHGSQPGSRSLRDRATVWRLALAEAAIQFAQLGRSVGLEIPWQVPRSILTSETDYVPAIDLSLLALAQHHGVPTQLLDWSEDPLTAAFFAIGDDLSDQDDLCVWALRISGVPNTSDEKFSLTSAPNVGNANMRAQSGMFLAYQQGPHLNSLFTDEQKNESLFPDGSWPSFEEEEAINSALIKITLCGSQRFALHNLLLREKRSRAHLMPSWDGVAQTLIEDWKARLQRPALSPIEHLSYDPLDHRPDEPL